MMTILEWAFGLLVISSVGLFFFYFGKELLSDIRDHFRRQK